MQLYENSRDQPADYFALPMTDLIIAASFVRAPHRAVVTGP